MADDTAFELDLDVDCDEAFRLLTELPLLRTWMPMTTFEAWVGGRVELQARGMTAVGHVLQLEPPHLLVYSWDWRDSPLLVPTRVTVTLAPRAGGTRLRLCHSGLSAQQKPGFTEGWAYYLPRLQAAGEGRGAEPDSFSAGVG